MAATRDTNKAWRDREKAARMLALKRCTETEKGPGCGERCPGSFSTRMCSRLRNNMATESDLEDVAAYAAETKRRWRDLYKPKPRDLTDEEVSKLVESQAEKVASLGEALFQLSTEYQCTKRSKSRLCSVCPLNEQDCIKMRAGTADMAMRKALRDRALEMRIDGAKAAKDKEIVKLGWASAEAKEEAYKQAYSMELSSSGKMAYFSVPIVNPLPVRPAAETHRYSVQDETLDFGPSQGLRYRIQYGVLSSAK